LASYWLRIGIILDSYWNSDGHCIGFSGFAGFGDYLLTSYWLRIGITLDSHWLHWLCNGFVLAPQWLRNGFAMASHWLRMALTFGEYSVNCARSLTVTLFEGSYLLLPFIGSFYAVTLFETRTCGDLCTQLDSNPI